MKRLILLLTLFIIIPFFCLQAFVFMPEYTPVIGANCTSISGYWNMPESSDPGYMHLTIQAGYDIDEVILANVDIRPNAYVYQGKYNNAPGAKVVFGQVITSNGNYTIGNLPYDLPNCISLLPMILQNK